VGVGDVDDIQGRGAAFSRHVGEVQGIADNLESIGNTEGVQLRNNGGRRIGDIRNDKPFMRGGDKRETSGNLDVTGEAVGFDVADTIRRGKVADIEYLYAAVAVGYKCKIILSIQPVDIRIR
jgi:hypothetical protein